MPLLIHLLDMPSWPMRTMKTQEAQLKTWVTFLRIDTTGQVKLVQVDPVMKKRRMTMTVHNVLQKPKQGWASQAQVVGTTLPQSHLGVQVEQTTSMWLSHWS